jgi:hypothetical protein
LHLCKAQQYTDLLSVAQQGSSPIDGEYFNFKLDGIEYNPMKDE